MANSKKNRILAVIPARGGSKGLKDKNIRPLLGKPLIGWILEEASKSREIDELIVSTDSPKIAKIAGQYGAKVPFLRPKELAQDETPGIDPILHALKVSEQKFDTVIWMQCTSPLTKVRDIDKALKMFKKSGYDSMVSVCPVKESPFRMFTMDSKKHLKPFLAAKKGFPRRQDLTAMYYPNGAIYISRTKILLQKGTCFTGNTGAFVMRGEASFDIDSLDDFLAVESYLKQNKLQK